MVARPSSASGKLAMVVTDVEESTLTISPVQYWRRHCSGASLFNNSGSARHTVGGAEEAG